MFNPGCTIDAHHDPFAYLLLDAPFDRDRARDLARHFPQQGFRESIGRDGHYALWDRSLVDEQHGLVALDDLSSPWRSLVAQFTAQDYRDTVARLTGVALANARLKLRLCKYPPGGWMQPHTDRPDRLVTQTFYLTEDWDDAWGGELVVLRSSAVDDVACTVRPRFNSSFLFARSDRSFHAVRPVASAARIRLSILAQFVRH